MKFAKNGFQILIESFHLFIPNEKNVFAIVILNKDRIREMVPTMYQTQNNESSAMATYK